jgi:DNA ligase-1
MDLVCVGAFFGRGRRAGWYGALLMAAYDPATATWQSVCKLGTGFDDATLMSLKDRFAPHLAAGKPARVESGLVPDAWFEPAIVMEVQAAELTLSPTHRAAWGQLREGAGLAARFPRFTGRWRDDKGPEQATTTQEMVRLHGLKGQAKA